jgi:hypothetical protein
MQEGPMGRRISIAKAEKLARFLSETVFCTPEQAEYGQLELPTNGLPNHEPSVFQFRNIISDVTWYIMVSWDGKCVQEINLDDITEWLVSQTIKPPNKEWWHNLLPTEKIITQHRCCRCGSTCTTDEPVDMAEGC